MQNANISYSCRGRLFSLAVCYLLGISSFSPDLYALSQDFYFTSDKIATLSIDVDRYKEVVDFLFHTFDGKMCKIALQTTKRTEESKPRKLYIHAATYLFSEYLNNLPSIELNGENAIYVGNLHWLNEQAKTQDLTVINLLNSDTLRRISEMERKENITSESNGNFDDKTVYETLRESDSDFSYYCRSNLEVFSSQPENSLIALATSLQPKTGIEYLANFIEIAKMIYKEAYLKKYYPLSYILPTTL